MHLETAMSKIRNKDASEKVIFSKNQDCIRDIGLYRDTEEVKPPSSPSGNLLYCKNRFKYYT